MSKKIENKFFNFGAFFICVVILFFSGSKIASAASLQWNMSYNPAPLCPIGYEVASSTIVAGIEKTDCDSAFLVKPTAPVGPILANITCCKEKAVAAPLVAPTTPKKPFITLDPILNLQVKIPGLSKLASTTPATCTDSGDKTSCSLPWISIYIKAIYNYSMGIVGILAALAMMVGGVIYLTSAGNASRISEAKSWIGGALTGMLIMFTSYILLNEINPNLIGFKPIELSIVSEEPIPMVPIEELSVNGVTLTASGSCSAGFKKIASHKNVDTRGNVLCIPTADKVEDVFKCMDRKWPDKYKMVVNDGLRSYQGQLKIFNDKPDCKPYFISDGKCNIPAGSSCNASCPNSKATGSHFSGAAIDIQAFEKNWDASALSQLRLQDCMAENGFVGLIAATKAYNELWHFENPPSSSGTKFNYNGGNLKSRNHLLGKCASCSTRRADFKKQYEAKNPEYLKYKTVYDRKDYDWDKTTWKNPFF